MKVRIIENPVKVYSDVNDPAITITELSVGSEVEIGGLKKKDGKSWVGVTLSNGQKGYISGEARIFHIKKVMLNQGNANVYSAPSTQSAVKTMFKKRTTFFLTDTVKQDNQSWIKIRDMQGLEGFIEPKTRIIVIQEAVKATKATGKKNMVVGSLWFIGGSLVTILTFSVASGGGSYIVAWGAILFGAFQFLQGLVQFLTAKD